MDGYTFIGAVVLFGIGFLFGYFTGKVTSEKKAKKGLLL